MEPSDSWFAAMVDATMAQLRVGADYAPKLLAAMLALVLGWLIARVARGAVRRLALASNRLLERVFPRGILAQARVSSLTATLLGTVVFWVTLLFALTIAVRFAGLNTMSGWLERIAMHLPHLAAAVTIVTVGYFVSVFVREQVAPQLTSGRPSTNQRAGRAAQVLVIVVALIVALDQIGIDVVLLTTLTIVCVAAPLAGLALAFALGAQTHVGNLLGAQNARKHMGPGVRIRVDGIEGEILEITATQIALDTDHGKALLPGRFVDERVMTIMAPKPLKEQTDA